MKLLQMARSLRSFLLMVTESSQDALSVGTLFRY
jgi:hypothetical protein